MRTRLLASFFVSLMIASGILFCQDTASVRKRVDSAAVIIVGRVVDVTTLGSYVTGVGFVVEATLFRVYAERTLKGANQTTTFDLLDPIKGNFLGNILLSKFHKYILFLIPYSVEETLRGKYGLGGGAFFTSLLDEDLNAQLGKTYLWVTEQYLSLPHVSVGATDVILLVDSLKAKVDQVIGIGGIGLADFGAELQSHLSNARTSLQLGDSLTSAKELQRFENKLEGGFGRMDSSRYVENQSFSLLSGEALAIRSFLARLPLSTLPHIGALAPGALQTGQSNQDLVVAGEGFVSGAIVDWNWRPLETRFVSSSELHSTVPSTLVGKASTVSIAVINPDGGTSNALPLAIRAGESGLAVKLVNSSGTILTGGSLQYYDGSWKDAVNNNDGAFNVNTTLSTVSLRMTYEGGSQTKSNVAVGPNVVVFQTVNTQVKLQNSAGVPIDTGTVQYYFSSWRAFGQTMNGVASKELLPANYTFRMSYASASKDKQQNTSSDPIVIFSTVNATLQLKNSLGAFIDQGTVQYYFNSWQALGRTMNGAANRELLPTSYTFRMAYETVTNDKVQDISTNSTVNFSTVLCTVTVKNTQGQPVDGAQVSYYFSSWVSIGATVGGQVTKELLPANLTFRETIGSATQNKQQNIGTNPLVEFVTQ